MNQIHGTCVALDGRGVILRGPAGAGKSDLALRLIEDGAVLVADDRVDLSAHGGRLIARAPENITGLLEARGIGIVRLDCLDEAPVSLIVDLVPADAVERMPAPASATIEGITLPATRLAPFEATSTAKVRLALRAVAEPEAEPS